MTLKGRDKNLQSTQIRRDIRDGEQKYYKSSATLCNERQSKHYHFIITAIAFSYSEAILKIFHKIPKQKIVNGIFFLP